MEPGYDDANSITAVFSDVNTESDIFCVLDTKSGNYLLSVQLFGNGGSRSFVASAPRSAAG